MNSPPFKVGDRYSRDDIKAALGVDAGRGGNWDTGYHRHEDMVFVFCTVGVPARTGHNYGDHWLSDGSFEWFGKTQSRAGQPLIDFMTGEHSTVLLFVREKDREPFTFEGQVKAVRVFDEEPVRVVWKRVAL